jgi:hypothetical protein
MLPNPVLTASGTAGHGAELGRYVDLASLGAVVVKSLAAEPWPGNPAPRVHETAAGMLNSVGLQGPGVDAWRRDELPALVDAGARVVASIWGRSVAEFEKAATALADAPAAVVAVEVNLSCPNVESRSDVFAHSAEATAAVVAATAACGRPRWAKLSPNVTDLPAIARAARDAGAGSENGRARATRQDRGRRPRGRGQADAHAAAQAARRRAAREASARRQARTSFERGRQDAGQDDRGRDVGGEGEARDESVHRREERRGDGRGHVRARGQAGRDAEHHRECAAGRHERGVVGAGRSLP